MTKKTRYDSILWSVLEKGRLADLSQFHRSPMFDEVPLYSRLADISFLSGLPLEEINRTLLEFSLRFLNSVIANESHRSPYLAAITVWNFSDDDPIVPNLFVWSGPMPPLRDKLTGPVKSPFGRKIKRLASHSPDSLEIFEETPPSNETARVFLGPSHPAFRAFQLLSKLATPKASRSKPRG